MERIPVRSTTFSSVGYDRQTSVLELEFASGSIYQYAGVSHETFEEFMAAPSQGAFFNKNIAKVYSCKRVG